MTTKRTTGKARNKHMIIYVIGGILLVLAVYLIVQGIRCSIAVKASKERLAAYEVQTAILSYGNMSYVDTERAKQSYLFMEFLVAMTNPMIHVKILTLIIEL